MDRSDQLVRWVMAAQNLRVATAITTDLVIDAATRHELSAAATCAVGRGLTAGLLLATLTKGKERVTLQIIGDGPLGSITVDAHDTGTVRGYALHPQVDALPVGDGRPRVANFVGRNGKVNVLRDLGLKELYQGQVAITSGEIDEDVEHYLRTSEQVPSTLVCDVVLDGNSVKAAGGILVQALPGGDEAALREVQRALAGGRLYEQLAAGVSSAEALTQALLGLGLQRVGEARALRFACTCTKERIDEMLALLSTADLTEMIAEGKDSEITCNYCNTHYRVTPAELDQIRARRAAKPRQAN